MEDSAEDDDDASLEEPESVGYVQALARQKAGAYLNDEDNDWVLWIILGGILALENAPLSCCSQFANLESHVVGRDGSEADNDE